MGIPCRHVDSKIYQHLSENWQVLHIYDDNFNQSYLCMNVVIPSLTLLFDHAIVTFKHCFMFHPSSPLPPL